jgi:hypothetical protein
MRMVEPSSGAVIEDIPTGAMRESVRPAPYADVWISGITLDELEG